MRKDYHLIYKSQGFLIVLKYYAEKLILVTKSLAFVKVMLYSKRMDSNVQLTAMADTYDQLVAECSPAAQVELQALAKWVSENILTQGGGVMSAKELILMTLKKEYEIKRRMR